MATKYMDTRTRQLLGLLADDAVDRLIAELAMAASTELALRRALGVSHAALQTRLNLLHALGVLDYETQRTDAPGRPGRIWHIRDPQTLGQFAKSAALLRRKLSH
jgi:transcription initiation factor IIE alpha subunit